MSSRKNWGAIRKLPSNRFQASFMGPDNVRHNAPDTFKTKTDATAWLATKRTEILEGTWVAHDSSPKTAPQIEESATTFEEYALLHIELQTTRNGELLRKSTKALYKRILKTNLKPFLNETVESITKPQISEWYAKFVATGKKTSASKAYKLLSAVLRRAAEEGKISKNPCGIRGAHSAVTGKAVDIPSADEVAKISRSIDPMFKTLVLVAAYGGFRFGELTELRRKDIRAVEKNGQVSYEFSVRRAVTYVNGVYVIDKPKSEASVRPVPISPALTYVINDHLFNVVPDNEEALLFPASDGGHLPHYVFIKAWNKALTESGIVRTGITPHSLRHFAGTHYHLAGATLPELMSWLGDSSIAAVQRYLHVTSRASEIASQMAISTEMPTA